MVQVIDTLRACVDCLMYVANGELPDDRAGLDDDIDEYLDLQPGQFLCVGEDADDEFSWHQCECCGSRLGGSRHEIIILGD